MSRALHGESSIVEDAHLVMVRNGYPEDTWFSFSFNPLRNETGRIIGTFAICHDSTAKVVATRRLSAERDGLWEASLDVSVVIDRKGANRWIDERGAEAPRQSTPAKAGVEL